jgi:hypothetical protein
LNENILRSRAKIWPNCLVGNIQQLALKLIIMQTIEEKRYYIFDHSIKLGIQLLLLHAREGFYFYIFYFFNFEVHKVKKEKQKRRK